MSGIALCLARQPRGLPPSEGILNFGKVDDHLFRGAQPDTQGVKNLQKLGVKMIINLRMTNDVVKAEADQCRLSGILYTNIPLPGVGRPDSAQVAKILATINASPDTVFIHCEHGCDRTGTLAACYRIEHDKWSGDQAMKEAIRYGISPLERGMRQFILDFAKDPARVDKK